MRTNNICRKPEKGSVLLTTIVLLLVLSIIVIMGANNSIFEENLSGNERCISQMRLNAESAALAGIEQFDELSDLAKNFNGYANDAWSDPGRPAWYHKGGTGNVAVVGSDVPNASVVALQNAKAYAELFYSNNFENKDPDDPDDNWYLPGGGGIGAFASGSCDFVIPDPAPAPPSPLASLANAKFMVIDTGVAKAFPSSTSAGGDSNAKAHQILITGVDESCGGKYMVQIAIIRSF